MSGSGTFSIDDLDLDMVGMLEACTVKGILISGPPCRLERDEYIKLARFMERLGGSWSKTHRCFVVNASERLLDVLRSGLGVIDAQTAADEATSGPDTPDDVDVADNPALNRMRKYAKTMSERRAMNTEPTGVP